MDVTEIVKGVVEVVAAVAIALCVAKVWIDALKKEVIEAAGALESAINKYKEATDESSPEGKKLSLDEIRELVAKAGDVFKEFGDVVRVIKEKFSKK